MRRSRATSNLELANQYEEWGYSGTRSASFVTQGMEWVTKAIGFGIDAVHVFEGAWASVQTASSLFFSTFLKGTAAVLEALEWIQHKTGNVRFTAGSEDLKKMAADMQGFAENKAFKAMFAFGHVGQGQGVARTLVDDIQRHATDRAAIQDRRDLGFTMPGAIQGGEGTHKLAAAAEFGSKEAYSTIVRTRVSDQASRAQERMAAGIQRVVALLEQQNAKMDGEKAKGDQGKVLLPHFPASF